MSGRNERGAGAPPWQMRVAFDAIPETGLHQELEASAAERDAMRRVADLRDLAAAHASFDLSHAGRGRIRAVGRVIARVGQTCVVTLEPVDNTIDEEVDSLFVPEEEVEAVTKAMDKEAEAAGEMADPPEAIVGGMLDLGKLAADALFLAIDPYPRKPDSVFAQPVTPEDPEDHPFAALKALQNKTPPKSGKN
jgi:uncharacterized metal-binding protein YceD (DUF177 family)